MSHKQFVVQYIAGFGEPTEDYVGEEFFTDDNGWPEDVIDRVMSMEVDERLNTSDGVCCEQYVLRVE